MAIDTRTELALGTTLAEPRVAETLPATLVNLAVPTFDALALTLGLRLVGAGAAGGAYLLLALALVTVNGGYRPRISPRLGDAIPGLLGQLALPLLLLGPFVAGGSDLPALLRGASLGAGLLLVARFLSYAVVRRCRARGLVVEPTLIIGAGQLGVEVARTLQTHPEYGLLPVAFLDGFTDPDLLLPIVGDVDALAPFLDEFSVRRVIVAFGSRREADLVRVLRACDHRGVEVHLVPRFYELGNAPRSDDVDDVWGLPLVRMRRAALRTAAWRTKRAFDVLASGLILLATAPVFLLAALSVRLSSPGPVFFRQRRVGQRGRPVDILKFRTMRMNDDSDFTWTVDNDSRRTAAGRFLRRTSIDELPQLLNVLKGDMSLVGPRPERPYFVERFNMTVPRYDDRHRVPVGLTGWAQIHHLRGDTSIEERVRFDNYYIEHWSPWQDLVILVRTLAAPFRRPQD